MFFLSLASRGMDAAGVKMRDLRHYGLSLRGLTLEARSYGKRSITQNLPRSSNTDKIKLNVVLFTLK